ncbi:membrane-bound lytic murein transglycosylase MltF [Salinimonas chungwhensis]|uniref:membrane-bound lytic murein transglycosylase MltF n=1 Tax=Salinimonas chungwhensis TaxID=265425 RepID=UPI0012EA74FA
MYKPLSKRPRLSFIAATLACARLMIMLLTVLLLVSCQPVSPRSALQNVLDDGVLKIGTIFGRTTFYYGNESPRGFEYELAQGFANYLGVEVQIYPFYSYQALMKELKQGRIDVAAAGDAVPDSVEQQYKLGPVYQQVSHKLVFLQGNQRPRNIDDLKEPLVVVKGSSNAHLLQQLNSSHPTLDWKTTDNKDTWELLDDVANGRLPYTLVDTNTLSLQRRQYPQLSIGFTLKRLVPIAWLMNQQQDDSLRAAVIEYFGSIQQTGIFKALEDKYFGHVRDFNYVDTRAFIESAKAVLPDYAHWFQQYATDVDWRLLAAMSYQESHWDPQATSYTGVRGLMMLTQDTARQLNIDSRTDAQSSIKGGARYVSNLLSRIPARIKSPDRLWMALAAYNIGMGHLEDARTLTQRQGGNPDLWVDVKRRLPQLEQKRYYKTTRYGFARGHEARQYVENIRRYYDTLLYLDENTDFLSARSAPAT